MYPCSVGPRVEKKTLPAFIVAHKLYPSLFLPRRNRGMHVILDLRKYGCAELTVTIGQHSCDNSWT